MNAFLNLVGLDGPVGGEEPVATEVASRLRALGGSVDRDSFGNVLARFAGLGDQAMLINAHLDCVQPCMGIRPAVADDVVRSDGTTVLGADNRAGVAATLEVLSSLLEDGARHLPLEIVFTLGEEAGLLGAKALAYSIFQARWGLTLDGAGPVGAAWSALPDTTLSRRPFTAGWPIPAWSPRKASVRSWCPHRPSPPCSWDG